MMPDNAATRAETRPQPAPVLILTRPAAGSERFLRALGTRTRGLAVVISPVLRIVPLTPDLPPVNGLGGLILTSENGAEAAARLDLPRHLPVWAVGPRTAEVAHAAGFDAVPAGGNAESLIALILSRGAPGPLLHLRGTHARGDIASRLRAKGLIATEAVAYDQQELTLGPEALRHIGGKQPIVLPVFSPRSSAIICGQGSVAAPLHVAAISAAAAEPFRSRHPASLTIATEPAAAAMVAACATAISLARGSGGSQTE